MRAGEFTIEYDHARPTREFVVRNKGKVESPGGRLIKGIVGNPRYPVVAVFTSPAADEEHQTRLYFYYPRIRKYRQYIPAPGRGINHYPYDIWSTGGIYAFFPGREEQFDIVRTADLPGYLAGHTPAYRAISARRLLTKGPGKVQEFAGWKSDNEFRFDAACCATTWELRFLVQENKLELIRKRPARP